MTTASGGDAVSSRPRGAKTLSIGLPVIVAVVAALAALAPPEWAAWRGVALVAAVSWFVWLLWAWPLILVGPVTAVVRNSFSTWGIPLATVESVEGGRRLLLFLRDGRRVWAVAVGGGEVVLDGIRRVDAYTEGGHFIRNADDLRPSARPDGRSDATEWAQIIRARLQHVSPDAAAHAVRRPNYVVAAFTAVGVGLLLAAIIAPV